MPAWSALTPPLPVLPPPRRFTKAEKALLKGTIDYFSINFYTAYFVKAPVNSPDPTMVGAPAPPPAPLPPPYPTATPPHRQQPPEPP